MSLVLGSGQGLDALSRGYLTTSKNRSQRREAPNLSASPVPLGALGWTSLRALGDTWGPRAEAQGQSTQSPMIPTADSNPAGSGGSAAAWGGVSGRGRPVSPGLGHREQWPPSLS